MKKLVKISAFALLAAAGTFAIANFNPTSVSAHDGDDQSAETVQAEGKNSNNPYSFTAQPGDSYTKIARKSVQIYGINNKTELSEAQIVAAETFLTSEAGFPGINAGQIVELKEDSVKAAVEKAKNLDQPAIVRWEKYTSNVDFNTNNVGESR